MKGEKIMKKLKQRIFGMENTALVFIRRGLEAVLYILIMLGINARINSELSGVDRVLFIAFMRECITYILLTVTLTLGGGLFIDFALKHEKSSRN